MTVALLTNMFRWFRAHCHKVGWERLNIILLLSEQSAGWSLKVTVCSWFITPHKTKYTTVAQCVPGRSGDQCRVNIWTSLAGHPAHTVIIKANCNVNTFGHSSAILHVAICQIQFSLYHKSMNTDTPAAMHRNHEVLLLTFNEITRWIQPVCRRRTADCPLATHDRVRMNLSCRVTAAKLRTTKRWWPSLHCCLFWTRIKIRVQCQTVLSNNDLLHFPHIYRSVLSLQSDTNKPKSSP